MINFKSENIEKTKKIIKDMDLKNIKKDYLIKDNLLGWQIHSTDQKKIHEKDLAFIGIYSLQPNSYIAHRHTSDIDYEYCHYILNTNKDAGIIIEDEYLSYENNLLFSFNYGTMPHIAWNNSSKIRDSLVFIYKRSNITMEDWLIEKNKVSKNQYVDSSDLKEDEILKMTKKFNVKLGLKK